MTHAERLELVRIPLPELAQRKQPGESEQRLGVVDLGSNSFRLVEFTWVAGEWWKRTDELYDAVRIGAGMGATPHAALQAGKGSGMLNSCSFLGGTVGVTFGGIVFALNGFPGVLVLLGCSALASAVLCLRLKVD